MPINNPGKSISTATQPSSQTNISVSTTEVTQLLKFLTQTATPVSVQQIAAETSLTVPVARKVMILLCDHNHIVPARNNGYQFVSSYSLSGVAARVSDSDPDTDST